MAMSKAKRSAAAKKAAATRKRRAAAAKAVSYTHLTLPTKRIV